MKNYILLLVCVLTQNLFSQENAAQSKPVENIIYNTASIDVKPEFPGGVDKMYAFLSENFKMPEDKNIKGKIFVLFVVETDGAITNIKVTREVGGGTGKEAIRVVKMFPKWRPGEKDGKKARCQYQIPIDIN